MAGQHPLVETIQVFCLRPSATGGPGLEPNRIVEPCQGDNTHLSNLTRRLARGCPNLKAGPDANRAPGTVVAKTRGAVDLHIRGQVSIVSTLERFSGILDDISHRLMLRIWLQVRIRILGAARSCQSSSRAHITCTYTPHTRMLGWAGEQVLRPPGTFLCTGRRQSMHQPAPAG